MSEHLSLIDLEGFDPRAPNGKVERRFCCPFCGTEKTISPAHRSLVLNTHSGAWMCHRCGRTGLLKDYWTKKEEYPSYRVQAQHRKQATLKRLFAVNTNLTKQPAVTLEEDGKVDKIRARYEEWVAAFPGSPAARYLGSRGIPEELAQASGCGYADKWQHWEQQAGQWVVIGQDRRVVFPVRDREGNLVAINARAIDSEYSGAKAISRGPKSKGVFAVPGALDAEMPIITEAPIDALSLAIAGFPAIAIIGTSWPEWLWLQCAFRTVGIATDADEAGDAAAKKLTVELRLSGSKCVRLRPNGGKDWNELPVSNGVEAIIAQIAALLGIKPKINS